MEDVRVFAQGFATNLVRSYAAAKTSGGFTYAFPITPMTAVEPTDLILVRGAIGVRIGGIAMDAAAKAAAIRLICVHKVVLDNLVYYDLRPYGTAIFTSDTERMTGSGSDFIADTVVHTADTYGTHIENLTGNFSRDYSKDKHMAEWLVPDLDNPYGIIIDRSVSAGDLGGGSAATNFNTVHEFMA